MQKQNLAFPQRNVQSLEKRRLHIWQCKACGQHPQASFMTPQGGGTPAHLVLPSGWAVAYTLDWTKERGVPTWGMAPPLGRCPYLCTVAPGLGHFENDLQRILGALLSGQFHRKWSLMARIASLSSPDLWVPRYLCPAPFYCTKGATRAMDSRLQGTVVRNSHNST